MTQESIVLSTTPPYPGLQMVLDINKALEALGTNFAGADDPAAFAKPLMTWADTGNMLLKRRNAAGSAWVTVGPLLEELAKKVGDASQRFKAAPSAADDDVVVQSQVPGVGQTLLDLTASRALNANITNLSGKEIKVYVYVTSTGPQGAVAAKFSSVYYIATSERQTAGGVIAINFPVPPGVTYFVEVVNATLTAWLENR